MKHFASVFLALIPWLAAPLHAAEPSPLAEADELRLRGQYAEAIAAYQKLEVDEARIGAARCLLETGRWREADQMLAKVADQADALAWRAWIALEQGRYDAAEKLAGAAIQSDADQLQARFVTAELHRLQGRIDEAQPAYRYFFTYYNRTRKFDDADDLLWIGQGIEHYARLTQNSRLFHDLVNVLYPRALKLNERYWPARLRSGRLFMEKYNRAEAAKDFDQALAANPRAAEVETARAELALQTYDLAQAAEALDRAEKIHPALRQIHQLRADIDFAEFRPEAAIEDLRQAQALNPRDEDTLGRQAAAVGAANAFALGRESEMERLVREVERKNPRCGAFYTALAESLDRLRQFPRAAIYYRRAAEVSPELAQTKGKLGMVLMRLGEEQEAARMLAESFKGDPFNVRVKNMKSVLGVLEDYETIETEHFIIRFDPRRDKILAQCAAEYLEREAYPLITKELGYEPRGKSLFEIFHHAERTSGHGWFSARMVGLPYIGTVGACAGKMVAIVSPDAMPRPFDWARVLRHEFVHVVNLQQTDFRIPHWYTEALAVHYEGYPRPAEWNRVLAQRLSDDQLFDLTTINRGFIRPRDRNDWALAYCQAELYADYMISLQGKPALGKLLRAYADNLSTAEAIEKIFEMSIAEFESGYLKFVRAEVAAAGVETPSKRDLAGWRKWTEEHLEDASAWAELAAAEWDAGNPDAARQAAETALKLNAKQPVAAYVLSRLALAQRDLAAARRAVEEVIDLDAPERRSLSLAGGLALQRQDFRRAEELYTAGRRAWPQDPRWIEALARVYLLSKNDERLKPLLDQLFQLDSDNVVVVEKLHHFARAEQDWKAAARWAQQLVYIVPHRAAVHAALGEARLRGQQPAAAVVSLRRALALDDRNVEWHRWLGEALIDAEQRDAARAVLEPAVDRFPEDEPLIDLLRQLESP